MRFCSHCGSGEIEILIPENDSLPRHVCQSCDRIHYHNPRIIVATLPVHEDKVLLCKRAIEPRYGSWTIPGGFLECNEPVEAGAIRETLEEANARVEIVNLHTMYTVLHVDQVYLIFRAKLKDLDFSAGTESLEVCLFSLKDIPWKELAFTSVKFALQRLVEDFDTNRHSGLHIGSYRKPDSSRRHS